MAKSKLTYTNFKKFVSGQPKDKEINHRSHWGACSIGDFYVSNGFTRDQAYKAFDSKILRNVENRFRLQLPEEVVRILSTPSTAEKIAPTYGKLNQFLQENV